MASSESVMVGLESCAWSNISIIVRFLKYIRAIDVDMFTVMAFATLPNTARAGRWFHALSDETRLEIVEPLSHGERCVCELQDARDTAPPPLSVHVKILKATRGATHR